MQLNIFKTHGAMAPENIFEKPPGELLDFIATDETFKSSLCFSEKDKNAGRCFTFCKYREDAKGRGAKYIADDSETNLLVVDVDKLPWEKFYELLPKWGGYSMVLSSSFSCDPTDAEKGACFRLIVEMEEPVRHRDGFRETMRALALLMGMEKGAGLDPTTFDPSRIWYLPQHQKGTEPAMMRLNGRKVSMDELRPLSEEKKSGSGVPAQGEASVQHNSNQRPDRQALKSAANTWKRKKNLNAHRVMNAIAGSEPYAKEGFRNTETVSFAASLMNLWPNLDYEWFADTYMSHCWKLMGNGTPQEENGWTEGFDVWRGMCQSALRSLKSATAERLQKQAEKAARFSEEHLAIVEEKKAAKLLVFAKKASYYIYNPVLDTYEGPFSPNQVPAAFDEYLEGIPGLSSYNVVGKNGTRSKSATDILREYGKPIKKVDFTPYEPEKSYEEDTQTLSIRAYYERKWEPVFHEITDELFKAVAGDDYESFCDYWSLFPDLNRPLVALGLVGDRKCWKTELCTKPSWFWANAPADAEIVMGSRFNSDILECPVIHSEEQLATNQNGKDIPNKYRKSISAKTHKIEEKGHSPVNYNGCVRHMMSVNDESYLFSKETSSKAIAASDERLKIIRISKKRVDKFESKWFGTEDLKKLREGKYLLEHIAWLAENRNYTPGPELRLGIPTSDSENTQMKMKLGNEKVCVILNTVTEAILANMKASNPGCIDHLPLLIDEQGDLRFSVARAFAALSAREKINPTKIKITTPQHIGKVLADIGFRLKSSEDTKANRLPVGGWLANLELYEVFLGLEDVYDKDEILAFLKEISKKLWSNPTSS